MPQLCLYRPLSYILYAPELSLFTRGRPSVYTQRIGMLVVGVQNIFVSLQKE